MEIHFSALHASIRGQDIHQAWHVVVESVKYRLLYNLALCLQPVVNWKIADVSRHERSVFGDMRY